jgi:sulfate adenylyltransferase subunit 2
MPAQTHLQQLENEAIYVLREVVGQFERPVILFSGGKDSITLAHLAQRAFAPAKSPLPWLHVDTGHNFPETLEFRDWLAAHLGAQLIVRRVEDSIRLGRVQEETGPLASRNALQTVTLMDAITELKIDCAVGGGRRDEEKARAKERIFSHRNTFGQWDPKNQRPELWNLYNGLYAPGEHFRAFPLSNWTELDVWQYIASQGLALPSLYFAHRRRVFPRDGLLLAESPFVSLRPDELPRERRIRFRTVGDATCTGAIESDAAEVRDIILETASARITERGGRLDDQRSEAAMEDRKRQGYF